MKQLSLMVRRTLRVIPFGLLCFVVLSLRAFAQTYYVSADGSDSYDGLSQSTAWKSISKVNSATLASGAQVLFRCGDEFRGQLTIAKSGVTIGSYGSGEKPIISGAEQLTNWVRRGAFYATKATAVVKNLYVNGVQMTLARYPNSGFIPVTSKSSSTVFTASGVTQASGYWTGANWRGRTINWSFETRTISAQSGTSITLSSAPGFGITSGWGFFLDNKLAALDTLNEWYCDASTDSVYLWAPGSVDPNTLTVEGSTTDYGISSSQSNLTVQGLECRYQVRAGMYFSGNNLSILNNKVYGSAAEGIYLTGTPSYCTIQGNIVDNVNDNGIYGTYLTHSTISSNTLRNIGMRKGYSLQCGADAIQICSGTYNVISGCDIDSVGYDGIYIGSYNTVINNVIRNTMQTLSDGGAIYLSYSTSNIVRHNIIVGVPGCNEGNPLYGGSYSSATAAYAIYLDQPTYSCTIDSNTVMFAGVTGVFLAAQDTADIVQDNIFYGCGNNIEGSFITYRINANLTYGKHVIKRNICIPTKAGVWTEDAEQLSTTTSASTFYNPGVVDSNVYFNPFGDTQRFYLHNYPNGVSTGTKYTLAGWQSLSGLDKHARDTKITEDSLFLNASASQLVVDLGEYAYRTVDSSLSVGTTTIAPYSSVVLIKDGLASEHTTAANNVAKNVPGTFTLAQNYPNPFNPSTQISYVVPKDSKVRLEVFDTIGRLVANLVDETQTSGAHSVIFDAHRLASGTYFYRLTAEGFTKTMKMLLLK